MPIERREQVFVSSTFLDLRDERQAVVQTLLEADCIPAGMELFPASDEEKWDLIRRVIDDCDYYVLIIGGRYGSLDEDGLSYTEKEFDYAVATKTPVMSFLHGQPDGLALRKSELDPGARQKLAAFRDKASQRMVKYWETSGDLAGAVARSLIQTRKHQPAEGWVRARETMTPEMRQELVELRAQVEALTHELHTERSNRLAASRAGDLAQGEDTFGFQTLVHYWSTEDTRNRTLYPRLALRSPKVFEVSWDEALRWLGPLLLSEATEEALQEEMNSRARTLRHTALDLPDDCGHWDVIDAGSGMVDLVKIQFAALGYVERSRRRHPVHDTNSYWSLTQEGRDYLLQITAARRGTATADGSIGPGQARLPPDPEGPWSLRA